MLYCSVQQKFGDYRWVPLEPEFIDYPNAQFLMIGEATDELGTAATAEPDKKEAHEEQPGEELEKLEHENEERIESLKGQSSNTPVLCFANMLTRHRRRNCL